MNKKEPLTKFVVTRFEEDISWIEQYTTNYLVYNKGLPIYGNPKILNAMNVGANQRDIFKFIYENYDDLPELMAFLQAYPYDHCKKEVFDQIIYNDHFTPLEYYGPEPANSWEGRTSDGGFLEVNNSWYLSHHGNMSIPSAYNSFDEFMNIYFSDYIHLDFLRFSPGSQYIITKANALYYPKSIYEQWMFDLGKCHNPREGHLAERSMYYILHNDYKLKDRLS